MASSRAGPRLPPQPDRLTIAGRPGLVGNHPLDLRLVGRVNKLRLPQMALTLLVLRGQDVAQVRMPPFHLPGRCFLEALRRSTVCF